VLEDDNENLTAKMPAQKENENREMVQDLTEPLHSSVVDKTLTKHSPIPHQMSYSHPVPQQAFASLPPKDLTGDRTPSVKNSMSESDELAYLRELVYKKPRLQPMTPHVKPPTPHHPVYNNGPPMAPHPPSHYHVQQFWPPQPNYYGPPTGNPPPGPPLHYPYGHPPHHGPPHYQTPSYVYNWPSNLHAPHPTPPNGQYGHTHPNPAPYYSFQGHASQPPAPYYPPPAPGGYHPW
jgi:hypothetical protein